MTSNQKVIGSTPVGRTRIFFSESPVSLIEKHQFSLIYLPAQNSPLHLHHCEYATYRHSSPSSMQDACHMDACHMVFFLMCNIIQVVVS